MDKIANSCNLYLTFSKDFFPAVRDLIEAENDEKGAACAGRRVERKVKKHSPSSSAVKEVMWMNGTKGKKYEY